MQLADIFEDDSVTLETAASRQPSEFVFTIWRDPDMPEGISAFVMTPIAYWRNKKKVWDANIRPFVHRQLPADCNEAASGFFISHAPCEELHAQLVERGFVYNKAFDEMIHAPLVR